VSSSVNMRAELYLIQLFNLSPPLQCLLNSSEKIRTGTHHSFLNWAVNVWPAWSPWPSQDISLKDRKTLLHLQPLIKLCCSGIDAFSPSLFLSIAKVL
jgi:hypothetical protein